jgi:hypothetical protein
MGRPRRKKTPVVHQVKLLLYPGEDDDLIAFFASIPARCKASAVKAAMRSGSLNVVSDVSIEDDEMEAALDGFLL